MEAVKLGSAHEAGILAVLNVVPAVELAYLETLFGRFGGDQQAVLNELFEKPYPRSESSTPSKGKKRARSVDSDAEDERDFLDVKERGTTDKKYRDEAWVSRNSLRGVQN